MDLPWLGPSGSLLLCVCVCVCLFVCLFAVYFFLISISFGAGPRQYRLGRARPYERLKVDVKAYVCMYVCMYVCV